MCRDLLQVIQVLVTLVIAYCFFKHEMARANPSMRR